jgi:hypothetical protein
MLQKEGLYGQIFLKFGLSFWQEYFFQPTFLQNLVCSINDLFNFQYSQAKTR